MQKWVHQADIDGCRKTWTTTTEAERIKQLERESKELKLANVMAGSGGGCNERES